MQPIEIVQQAAGMKLVSQDGETDELKLLSALNADELSALERRLLCPLPAEARALLQYSRGFQNGPVESVDFSGLMEFGMEEVFPCAIPIAHDGFGNYWVVDLTSQSQAWAPVFFVCHDPAVIVYQSATLAEFVEELLKLGNPPYKSTLDEVHETSAFSAWKDLSRMWPAGEVLHGDDAALREFAAGLGGDWLIADLRNAAVGDGYPWGRFGPRTANRRMGEQRVFAIQRKSGWKRLLGG